MEIILKAQLDMTTYACDNDCNDCDDCNGDGYCGYDEYCPRLECND